MKPTEQGNAKIFKEVCNPVMPLLMLRYQSIAEHLTQEPETISVRQFENDDNHVFEKIFRIRMWIPNDKIDSWLIYCEDREYMMEEGMLGGLVIRHISWDRRYDRKRYSTSTREIMLSDWPTISARSVYLNSEESANLTNVLKNMDAILSKGIILTTRETEMAESWNDLEIERTFSWGRIHSVWNMTKESIEVECLLPKIYSSLSQHLKCSKKTVYEMTLDYGFPPEEMKRVITGV